MNLDSVEIDKKVYYCYDEFSKFVSEYRMRNPLQGFGRDSHNAFFAKRYIAREDMRFGEVIASAVSEKTGVKACDAELAKIEIATGKYENGVISFVHLGENDSIVTPTYFLGEYAKKIGVNSGDFVKGYGMDVDSCISAVFAYMQDKRRPYQEFLDFKQDFVDMLMFDCLFLNVDRRTENWLLRRNDISGEIDLYPMFDNEMILGLDVEKDKIDEDFGSVADKRLSAIVVPGDGKAMRDGSRYDDLMRFLLLKYPTQARKAYEKLSLFGYDDLAGVLEHFEGMSDRRKKNVLGLFDYQRGRMEVIFGREKKDVDREFC